jgi:preprotein translocase subunit SecE
VAKTRAQRKAERRKREERRDRRAQQRQAEAGGEGPAQHDTQTGVSGDVAEAEAIIETGARADEYGEHTVDREIPDVPEQPQAAVPGVTPAPVAPPPPELEPEPEPEPEPAAPSRADVGRPDQSAEQSIEAPAPARESREDKKARRDREKEDRRKARAKQLQKGKPAEQAEKRRGVITGFIASCWAELKRVQWPDRDTLVQASAVTLIFVAIAAAYLGALDTVFNWLVKQIL